MDIEGRIILDLGIQSGTSKAGNLWKKRELVLETFGQYPRKVKFHIFGDKVDTIKLEAGKDYVLSFDLESREYNGRWYTDVNVYRAQDFTQQAVAGGMGAAPGVAPATSYPGMGVGEPPFGQPGGFQGGFGSQGFASGSFSNNDEPGEEDLPF